MMKDKRIKVLLILHSAALESSRKIFAALATYKEIQLRVLGPRKGYNPARNLIFEIPHPYYGSYDLVTGRVYKAMQEFTGPYLSGLLREMLRFRPHVIHVMNEVCSRIYFQTLVYRNLFLPSTKVLFFGFENILPSPNTFRSRWKWDFICHNSNGCGYANTEGLKKVVELGHPPDNLVLTYWGIPLEQFTPLRNELLRKELGLHNKFVVGYSGRFLLEKGLLTLLHALKYLPEFIHCLCVGDGPWLNSFLSKVKDFKLEDRIHWVPRVPEDRVSYYLNALDVLLLPSETTSNWKEQFGRVLPEAMACGIPVIGSDSGAIPEVIGDAGKIFPERDCYALAAVIRNLYENPELCRQLGSHGMQRAKEYFSCETFAKKLVQLYLQTIKPLE